MPATPATPHISCQFEELAAPHTANGEPMRIARLTLRHAGKFNAMSYAMWGQLRSLCEELQAQTRATHPLRCVLLEGTNGHFCAGADIAEFPSFRFETHSLRHFHEKVVWPALAAVLALDCPVIAAIDGHCMGAGLEMACCCDIRIATTTSRFGAPIAKLGFPMAPHETALLARVLGETCTRSILLEAAVYPAAEILQRGFITRTVADAAALQAECLRTVQSICSLGPACARQNKQTLRALQGPAAHAVSAGLADALDPYAYANSAEHREGITAFLEKRPPRF